MKPVRVLHAMKGLGLGGAEKNLLNLTTAMDPARVENHIAYCHGGGFEERFAKSGLRLFKYSRHNHKLKSPRSLVSLARLWRYVVTNKIDIIQSHNFNAHVLLLAVARWTRTPLFEHVHDFRYIDVETRERGHCFINQYRHAERLGNRSDLVIVLTAQNRDYLIQKKLYAPEKIKLMRNGIPMQKLAVDRGAVRRRFGVPDDHAVVLTPMRMAPEKNPDILFRIVPDVIRAHPRTAFVVAGDGPLLEPLSERAKRENLDSHLRFVGFHADAEELIGIADILLLPSFLELHSIAILEALSQGVPVIASRQAGCNAEVFTEGRDAILLDPFSASGWAEAVSGLLGNSDERRRIGEAGRALAARDFDIRTVARAFEELYAERTRR